MSSNETRLPNSSLIYFKSLLVIVNPLIRDRVKVDGKLWIKPQEVSLEIDFKDWNLNIFHVERASDVAPRKALVE